LEGECKYLRSGDSPWTAPQGESDSCAAVERADPPATSLTLILRDAAAMDAVFSALPYLPHCAVTQVWRN
jgi:hypothetical protein